MQMDMAVWLRMPDMCECTQACECPCAFGLLPSTRKALVRTGSLGCYSFGQVHALLDHLPLENNSTAQQGWLIRRCPPV